MSDLELEQFLVDDLDPDAQARVSAAIAADPLLQAHIEARRAEQRAFWSHAATPAAISPARRPFTVHTLLPAFAAAAALVLLILVVPRDDGEGADDGVHTRGADSTLMVRIVVQRAGLQFPLAPGVPLRAGDALRIELDGKAAGFATVVLVDVHGQSSILVDGERLPPSRPAFLEGSFVLDDSVGRERLIVVAAPQVIRGEALVRALGTPQGLAAVGEAGTIAEVSIEKEP